MKNSSGFSYTLSAFTIVALIAFLAGYYLANKEKKITQEGFKGWEGSCNVCRKPKPSCGCPPCETCQKPQPLCGCKPKPRPVRRCPVCTEPKNSCGCGKANVMDGTGPDAMHNAVPPAPCPVPDPTKYVLKSTVPPCPGIPDMSRYMLKTECPSQPDMSKYVLKSSVPKCAPCISTCSKPCKIGECPPCPRPRCPIANCPEPKACPACPAVQVASCPEPRVQCKAAYEPNNKVRPMLASTAQFGL